ncbi:MAG: hypothetical protein M3Y66_09700 [Actinomycetota bacterium]|nr:hypothetical protein [Actinomycetota bacterium]
MTSARLRHRKRGLASLLAGGVALLTLTGCGMAHPGVAVQIGNTSISRDEVNTITRIQCDLVKRQQGGTAQARTKMAQATVNILIESAVDNLYGASVGATYDGSVLRAAVQQFRTNVATLAPKDQDAIVKAFTDYQRGQLMLKTVGEQKLMQQGQKSPAVTQAVNEGHMLATAWATKLDIQIDPRYSPGRSNQAGGGDGSISRSVSAYAKSAAGATSPSFVAALPSGLRCG